MKLVDVLVFTNNHGELLDRCIISVLKQSIKDISIKVFENNKLPLINSEIRKKVDEYYHIPEIQGPSKLRNYGISKSKSRYIAIIDGDDYWHKDKIKYQITKIQKTSDNIIFTRIYNVYEKKVVLDKSKLYSGSIFLKLLFKEVSITGSMSGIMVTNHIIKKLKKKYGYIFDEDLDYCEDFDFFIRLATLSKFQYIDKPLVYITNNARSHQSKFNNYQRTIIKYKMINQNIKKHRDLISKWDVILFNCKSKIIILFKFLLDKI